MEIIFLALKIILNLTKNKTTLCLLGEKVGLEKSSILQQQPYGQQNKVKKPLIVSTDPAHSLSDSLEVPIGHYPREIKTNLFAVEIDPDEAMASKTSSS